MLFQPIHIKLHYVETFASENYIPTKTIIQSCQPIANIEGQLYNFISHQARRSDCRGNNEKKKKKKNLSNNEQNIFPADWQNKVLYLLVESFMIDDFLWKTKFGGKIKNIGKGEDKLSSRKEKRFFLFTPPYSAPTKWARTCKRLQAHV
jgi:hypothetical protein